MPKQINTIDDFNSALEDSKTKVIVIDFTAAWCGPCRYMSPIFDQFHEEYGGRLIFFTCDVDDADDVAAKCGVAAMPTFQFYKNGMKIQEMLGADQTRLLSLIQKHAL